MYGPGDVRVGEREAPRIVEPTDAIIRVSAACVCGSDLWPYRGVEEMQWPAPMGHEYAGIVEEVGADVRTVQPGQFVVGSFWATDNTCEICRAGYQSACVDRIPMGALGAQAELLRVPLADGTLVATPDIPSDDLVPSLLSASDVLGTGWFGAVAAEAGPSKTVAVVGDCAVGLHAVLAAKQLGAERIIAMSRHESRQRLAREYGATDIVEARGDARRRRDQGAHERARRALRRRGRRHPRGDDAGHPRRTLDLQVEDVVAPATAVAGALGRAERVVRDEAVAYGVGEHPAERDERVLDRRLGEALVELRAEVPREQGLVDRAERELPERWAQVPAPDALVLVERERREPPELDLSGELLEPRPDVLVERDDARRLGRLAGEHLVAQVGQRSVEFHEVSGASPGVEVAEAALHAADAALHRRRAATRSRVLRPAARSGRQVVAWRRRSEPRISCPA